MKTCSETFQFEKDLKWENPAPGVNRQIRNHARALSQPGHLRGER